MNGRIEEYLSVLEASLVDCPGRKKILEEVKDHLISACASYEARGLEGADAAQSAISDFGDMDRFAEDMKAEHGGRASQSPSARSFSVVFGGLAGALLSSFGLIDTSGGELALSGGNEWTPVVTGIGMIAGAFLLRLEPIRGHCGSLSVLSSDSSSLSSFGIRSNSDRSEVSILFRSMSSLLTTRHLMA